MNNGFCIYCKIVKALELLNAMVEKGYWPDVVTYGTIVNGTMDCAKQEQLLVCIGRWMEEDASLIGIVLPLTIYAWMGY